MIRPSDHGVSLGDSEPLAALRDAVFAIARGEAPTGFEGDPELEAALQAIQQRLPSLEHHPQADGTLGVQLLVMARADRFDVLRAQFGDEIVAGLLGSIRDRILTVVPDARFGRIGAGIVEFSLAVADLQAGEAALARLHEALRLPIGVADQSFVVPITMGAARLVVGLSVVEAAQQAQRALTHAEEMGATFDIFCDQKRADVSERLALMRDLRDGLTTDQFSLAYQPKLNIRADRIDSVEALVRWTHPERGAVPPDTFIELAEETGDIRGITEQVVRLAVRDQAALTADGHRLCTYVNLSGRLLTDEAFCRWMLKTCEGLEGRIGIEITETAVIADPERALRNLGVIADAGLSIAIDDYGSGLSSLSYLKALPANELKIDKAFVLGLSSSHRDPLIVRSTIDLAHALGMEITAEGVDDPTALALLSVMGCDRAQGYLIARPVALEGLLTFLKDHRNGRRDGVNIDHPLLALSRAKKEKQR